MNLPKQGTRLAILAVLAASSISVTAIEGLHISVQCPDVILSWPSIEGETFIVQHRSTLNTNTPWVTLADWLPAATGTNTTSFVHANQVQCPSAGTNSLGGGESGPPPTPSFAQSQVSEPLVKRADGSGSAVPLCIYPPGFDLSPFIIFEPSTGDWVSGSGYTVSPATLARPQRDDPQPEDDDPGGSGPATGFYRVLGVVITGGITNNTSVSDYISSITAKPEIGLRYMQLLVDGQRYPAQDILIPPFTNTIAFEWVDTTRVSNGTHTIQAEAVYQFPEPGSEGLLHVLSQPFQLDVFNEISFPAWDDMTEDEVCNFDNVSAHPVVDWEIDIYNIFDYIDWLNGQVQYIYPIHVMTGSTTNGIIQYDWDYLGDDGYPRNDPDYDPYFVSFTYTWWSDAARSGGPRPLDAAGSASTGNPLKRQPAKWPALGHWVVSWQEMFRHLYDRDNRLHNAFTSILSMANLEDTPPFWQGPIGGTNAQTFPARYFYNPYRTDLNPTNNDFFQSTVNDQLLLERMLRDSRARNFFYFGHGEPNWICSLIYANLLRDYGMHRYRFVWLDGCETGNGTWPETFGIPGPGTFSIDYYKERTKRPALFVGNKYSVPIGNLYDPPQVIGGMTYNGEIARSLPEFYGQFIFWWQTMGRPYKTAVQNAQQAIQGAWPDSFMTYSSGPKRGQRYWPGDDQARVGYDDMGYNTYNYSYDIPRP